MGTFYTEGASKAQIVSEIIADHRPGMLQHKLVLGNVLWAVVTTKEGLNYAALFHLVKSGGSWGYKPMDEGMGPYFFSFPVHWLSLLAPPPNEFAAKWRERVREYDRLRKTGASATQAHREVLDSLH